MAAPNQVSFLPDDYLDGKVQRRTNTICAALFLVVVCAIGSAFWFTERTSRELARQSAAVDRKYAQAAQPIEQFKKLQDKQRQMDRQAALTASLLEKVPRTYILADVTNALPSRVSLLEFTLDARPRPTAPTAAAPTPRTQFEAKKMELDGKKAAAAPEPRIYDVTVKIAGVADSDLQVAAFITQLSKSPLFQDVNLVVSDEFEQTHDKVRKFQIDMTLNPKAQVEHAPPLASGN